jgi:membrane-bound serine protease (ClpP class)
VLIVIAIFLLLFVLSPLVGALVLVTAIVFEAIEVVFWRRVLARYRIGAGPEAMLGETAVVVDRCQPAGTVRLRGEIWKARCRQGAGQGQIVRILAVDGLTLEVEPAPD